MKTHTYFNQCFEFYFRDNDTRVFVEDSENGVVIRASRDTFSERRKLSFIRELAAEGFIADCFQRSCAGIRWLVDAPPAKPNKDVAATTNRFMIRLFMCSVLLWLALMAGAVRYGQNHPPFKTIAQSEVHRVN